MKKSKEKYLPLDQTEVATLNSKTDTLEQRPALHSDLCQQKLSGNLYRKIPPVIEGSHQEWLDMLDAVSSDLQWILSLIYKKFWCQVVNDQSIHACLDSYLRFAPRYKQSSWPEDLTQKHDHTHKLVFMVFLRMSTMKESPEHFMTEELFSRVIYNNFLFDVPRMMDLCSLYGVRDNIPLLKKMLENIFHHQPHYYEDLKEASKTVVQIICQIEQKCLASFAESDTPNRLTNGPPKAPLVDMSEQNFKDIIFYIHDVLRTIQLFAVDVFPEAAQSLYEIGIIGKLQKIYSEVLPSMRDELRNRQSSLPLQTYHELRTHVRQSRESLLDIVGGIIKSCAYQPVMEAIDESSQEEIEGLVEEYFDVLSSLLSDLRFFEAFQKKFDIRQDVRSLSQACPHVGETQAQFFFQAMGDPPEHEDPSLTISDETLFNGTQAESSLASSLSLTNPPPGGTSDAETASLISSVRDVLPDLGVEFVNACIQYFDYDPEKVIQAILEDNLPPHLQNMNRTVSRLEPITADKSSASGKLESIDDQPSTSQQSDYMKDRKNIYDNDRFDVFAEHSRFDRSAVHYGKSDKSQVSHWAIDDDPDAEKLRELYSRYGLGIEMSDNDGYLRTDDMPPDYDDEYDDTYDDVAVGANDADSADELMEKRNKELTTQSDEENGMYKSPDPRHFIENPEILRAKEEAKRRQREGDNYSRGGGRGKRFTRHSPSEKRPTSHKHPPRRYQEHIPRDRNPKDPPSEEKLPEAPLKKSAAVNVPPLEKSQKDPFLEPGDQKDSSKSSDKNIDQRKGDKAKRGAGNHHRKVWAGKKAGGGGFKGR